MTDKFAGLPIDARELLAAPPDGDHLVELGLAWRGLEGPPARAAQRLAIVVLTRDPLDWLPARGWAWATAAGEGRGYRIALYATLPGLLARSRPVLAELTTLAESVVTVAADHERRLASDEFAARAARGHAPRLLDHPLLALELDQPVVTSVPAGWRPVGVQALRDLVREAFGPPHRRAGGNPAASAALERALRRLGRVPSRLPPALDRRLAEALERGAAYRWDPVVLRADAGVVFDLAEHFVGDPEGFAALAAADPRTERWVRSLVGGLARAGEAELAVEVGDVLGDLDPGHAARHADEVVHVLAGAGRIEEATARAEMNRHDFPDDPTVRRTAKRLRAGAAP